MNIFNSLGSNYDLSFVLKSLFTFGENSKELEKLLEEKYGGKVVLLYKGREAIELALKTLDLSKDSYVAINGFTCFAVYEAVKNSGLNIEYLDIDKGSLNFSADTLEEALGKNSHIKVVTVQNTLGYPCNIEEISKLCKEKNITLIEDLAHFVGTKYPDGKEAGSVGDMVVLSFSQDKMIDGISGGALITKNLISRVHLEGVGTNQQLVDRLYPLFTLLIRSTYSSGIGRIIHFIMKKLNLLSKPMDGVENSKLHELPNWYTNLIKNSFENLEINLNHRKTIASIYAKSINTKIISKNISDQLPLSSNLRFPIFVNNRASLVEYLKKHQIYVSDIWYDAPISPKKYLIQTDYKKGLCPNSELASDAILNLPTHINVSEKDAQNISNLINKWLSLK